MRWLFHFSLIEKKDCAFADSMERKEVARENDLWLYVLVYFFLEHCSSKMYCSKNLLVVRIKLSDDKNINLLTNNDNLLSYS